MVGLRPGSDHALGIRLASPVGGAAEPKVATSNSPAATANRPDGGEHDDRADHGNDDAFDIDAGWVFQLQEGAREPTTDDCPDDAQEDCADQSFAATHDHV